ncbi:MAG: DUF1638 domain-containing protein [Hyphomicrobiales bacterium]|nr:DUF1638 domain-containing protein [Hyphomicrobiales bacterium]MDE2017441.1 DUF1638 domain-containing protein [Hyphomicrobiales bacterium]
MRKSPTERPDVGDRTLAIACGATARELLAVLDANGLGHVDVTCLPAHWHNRPEKIAPGVRAKIRAGRRRGYGDIVCLYGDCGSGGALDAVLAQEGVERIEGAHCYAFYAGVDAFEAMHEEEPGTFYLTDYLVRHFERLVVKGLGLDRHPELRDDYFRHYARVVYLAQAPDDGLRAKAAACAARLGLPLECRATGYGLLGAFFGDRKGKPDHGGAGRRPVA